jgi:predicted transcriptional regulator
MSETSRYISGHRLPRAEAEVLEILLDAAGPLTVSELKDALPQARANTTIATLLGRLSDRGLVQRRLRERVYEWSPVADRDGLQVLALRQVLDRLDEPSPAVIGFLESLTKRKGRGRRAPD